MGIRQYQWITVLSKACLPWLWVPFPRLSAVIFLAPEAWLAYQTTVPNASGLGRVTTRFATRDPVVWLTIDDGPDPRTTPAVLDLLDSFRARAVFFVIGERARRHPDLLRMIADRGHELGNHTQTHPLGMFWCAGRRRTEIEVDACSDAIESAVATRPRFFRSPAGIKSPFLFEVLARRRLTFLGWSGRGRETGCSSPERPLQRLVRRVTPGAILLTHESGSDSRVRLAVIAGLLEFLSRRGYRCVLPEPGPRFAQMPDSPDPRAAHDGKSGAQPGGA
jgi:peptidoglycan/xylan/chitin deacetylase (PgdA/CDA1 family)